VYLLTTSFRSTRKRIVVLWRPDMAFLASMKGYGRQVPKMATMAPMQAMSMPPKAPAMMPDVFLAGSRKDIMFEQ